MDFILKILLFVCIASKVAFANDEQICMCGIFKVPTANRTTEQPIFEKAANFWNQSDKDGREDCATKCRVLAEVHRVTARIILCEALVTTKQPITPMVYSKRRGESEWVNTGFRSNVELCCLNGHEFSCRLSLMY